MSMAKSSIRLLSLLESRNLLFRLPLDYPKAADMFG